MKSITNINLMGLCLALATVFFTFSCQMEDAQQLDEIEEIEEVPNLVTGLTGFLFGENFEGTNPLSGVHIQAAEDYSYSISDRYAMTGKKSARFELRSNDKLVANGTRSEMLLMNKSNSKEKWYSFAVYFPENGYSFDNKNELIAQWHQNAGSPSTSLRIINDQFYIRTLPTEKNSNWKNIYFGPVVRDTWTEFVFHIIHREDSKGLIEIWRNGEKVVEHYGPNNYDSEPLPNWKLGIYKASWNSSNTGVTKVIYMDNIRIGDAGVKVSDMVTGGVLNLADKMITDSKDIELIVVNADNESLHGTLHPGEIIYRKRLGSDKLSLYADVDSRIKSVNFKLYEMKGNTYELKLTTTDTSFPFLLFGDDGKGNYFFGNTILDKGKYKVVVSAYADKESVIQVGDKYESSFKIY